MKFGIHTPNDEPERIYLDSLLDELGDLPGNELHIFSRTSDLIYAIIGHRAAFTEPDTGIVKRAFFMYININGPCLYKVVSKTYALQIFEAEATKNNFLPNNEEYVDYKFTDNIS